MKNSNQTQFQKESSRQFMWEMWFTLSWTSFALIFFICTLEGSREVKELPYLGVVAIINLAICVYKGCKTRN
jgi:hypothetical protein